MRHYILLLLLSITINANIIAVEKCASSVVQIHIERSNGEGIGSGIILDSDGYIVTNAHVVNDSSVITVTLPNINTKLTAKLIGFDKDTDIALIKVNSGELDPAIITTLFPKRGEDVFTVGYPFHTHQSISRGIVSALHVNGLNNAKYESYIEIDANINHGNSGGALCNSDGELLGMNSASFKGFGFSIEIDKILLITNVLKTKGIFERSSLGISVEDSLSCSGSQVTNVNRKSNFKVGDCIVAIDKNIITSTTNFANILGFHGKGDIILFEIIRSNVNLAVKTLY